MKRFLAKVLLLAVFAAGIVAALALFAYSAPVSKRFGPEVFRAIRVCTSAAPGARTLVLGDSVANQIFATGPAVTGAVAAATCNQAVTPLGNRILLDRWLALNPQAEEVVYVALPGSFANDGLPEFTFHYLLFPFAETGLFDGAPPDTLAHLRRRFGRLPIDNASVRHLLYRNDRLYDFYERRIVRRRARPPGGGLPEIVVENLRAMRDACTARGVRFRLAFPPVREDRKPADAYLARLADQLRDICPEIDGLVANLRAEPPEYFRDDVHFTRERLGEIRAELRAGILEGKERP
ncbi:MAG: hypothetical protein IJL06_02595 [Kiritimatiellae bacterium]|nr:hypothetical protein [Kiritimatiellia bacterium]